MYDPRDRNNKRGKSLINTKAEITQKNLDRELSHIARRLKLENIEQTRHFPKYFQIETSRICNARCTFCPIDEWDKTTPLMDDKLFEKIADELAEHKDWMEWVTVSRAGEPLLDKKIVDRVKMLKDKGLPNVNLTTNASLLFKKTSEKLLRVGLDEIWISIDSVSPEGYEKTRVGLKYEVTMKNIMDFFELRKEINPKVVVRVRGVCLTDLTTEDGKKELKMWEDFWAKHKMPQDRIYMKQPHNWGNQKELENPFGDGTADYINAFHPCISPFSTMHITAMGTVALCAMDYDADAAIGNIKTETIADVWRSESFEKYRRLHETGNRNKEPMCIGCRVWDEEFSIEEKDKEKDERFQRIKTLKLAENENSPPHKI
jgi:radical SAM protein with 4Fe4S-binding SPASM domain